VYPVAVAFTGNFPDDNEYQSLVVQCRPVTVDGQEVPFCSRKTAESRKG